MVGRIPMKGGPKSLDPEALARDLRAAVPRMHEEAKQVLADAEASGDQAQINEARAVLRKAEKLMNEVGLDT